MYLNQTKNSLYNSLETSHFNEGGSLNVDTVENVFFSPNTRNVISNDFKETIEKSELFLEEDIKNLIFENLKNNA